MTINEIIIATTFGVCLVGILAGVWSVIMTRVFYAKHEFHIKQCSSCKNGSGFKFPVNCPYSAELSNLPPWIMFVSCGKWEER